MQPSGQREMRRSGAKTTKLGILGRFEEEGLWEKPKKGVFPVGGGVLLWQI